MFKIYMKVSEHNQKWIKVVSNIYLWCWEYSLFSTMVRREFGTDKHIENSFVTIKILSSVSRHKEVYWGIDIFKCCVNFCYSKVNQLHVYMYLPFFRFPSHLGKHRAQKSLFYIRFLISCLFYAIYIYKYIVYILSKQSHSVMSNSLWPRGLQPTRLLSPWDSPGKNTGVGCHFLLQGIFLTQGSNLGLQHWRQML